MTGVILPLNCECYGLDLERSLIVRDYHQLCAIIGWESFSEVRFENWRDGSAVKNMHCSWRRTQDQFPEPTPGS